MADDDRLTKKERRELARAERRRKEEEERKRARRSRIVSSIVTVLVVGLIAAILFTAFSGDESLDDEVLIDFAAAQEARTAAGCEVLQVAPTASRDHLDPATAPPPDALYTTLRPTASGPHFQQWGPIATFGSAADERSVLHNLEHGAVVVWYDDTRVEGETIGEIESWVETLNDSGFEFGARGGGIISSPYNGTFTSGKPIAFRAWERALDCDTFDETVAHSFVIENFGTAGAAPEGNFSPFPEGVLAYDPDSLPTAPPTQVPTDAGTVEPTEAGTEGTEAPTTEPTPTEEPSPAAS
ncbi:MAG: DUF3105 domain-containing protein [Actinobacteria bacterium]|nr:DUF3105 domain-containing protein [Actinomycetota bacterium]